MTTSLPATSGTAPTLVEEPALAVVRPLDENPTLVYLARLAPGSRGTMREALTWIAGFLSDGRANAIEFDWGAVRYQYAAAVRRELANRYPAATANKKLAALRGVLREAWRLGQMSAEDYHRAVDLERIRGETTPPAAGRALSAGEVSALSAACSSDPTPAGARDAAMIGLMATQGLRRSEVVALDVADYEPATGALTLRQAKGNKDRVVYATNGAAAALADWLEVRGDDPGALFCPVLRGGRVRVARMYSIQVARALHRRAEAAGVASFTPHDLRRTYAGDAIDAGTDLVTVQRTMGHSSPTTTAGYDRRGERAKRDGAAKLHYPYAPRRSTGA